MASQNLDTKTNLPILGSTELVDVSNIKNIPAKIDTGADSSAIWVSHIDMKKDGTLVFSLFGEKSPFYTGELIETKDYIAKSVRSSHGDSQIRYQVTLPLTLGGKTIKTPFTLANRSRNNFPILIGRRTLSGLFLVDVSKTIIKKNTPKKTKGLNQELEENPYKFHQKYIKIPKGES